MVEFSLTFLMAVVALRNLLGWGAEKKLREEDRFQKALGDQLTGSRPVH